MSNAISVIIPTINEASSICELVTYLLKNQADEVIVVDGGSEDNTPEVAKSAGAKVLIAPVRSRAAQMNYGAANADGNILYFVHADTIPPSTFKTDILDSLNAGYKMGCYRYIFRSKSWLLRFNAWMTRFNFMWCQGGDKTFFIRREYFESKGGFNEYYTIMEEYDFLSRVLPESKLLIVPKNASVSARKYEQNSWLRVQLANIAVFNLYRLGVAPEKLKRIYKSILRPYA